MPSFGEKLKLEREKRKVTLEQISSTTKIGTRMLQALEDEKFSQLPGGIFNKGFVRAYARTLGLDEDQTVADYMEASGDGPPVQVEPVSRDNSRSHVVREPESGRLEIRAEVASRQLPWGILAVVLLIIALGLSLWNYHRREQERLANEPKPAVQHAATQTTDQNASSKAASGSTPQPAPASELVNSSASPAASPLAAPAGASQSEASTATPAPGEFVVVIQARDESWLSVFVDGKPAGSETVEAGNVRSYHARERVTVKAGNAGALDFRLNGKALLVGGDPGEVRTVTIGPDGVMPSAPSAVLQ
ncbi:MAG: RodZ domain-containing protein [Terriglobales bacterium]